MSEGRWGGGEGSHRRVGRGDMGRTQFIALTSPCGGGIDMQRAGGPACSRSGGDPVVGRRVPSVPAGCPVRRLFSSGPSSLAGGVGVAGYHRWRSCPCTGCLVAGSGGGSVGAAAAGVDWSVGLVLVCCQCRSACWLAGVGVFVCCQCLSVDVRVVFHSSLYLMSFICDNFPSRRSE